MGRAGAVGLEGVYFMGSGMGRWTVYHDNRSIVIPGDEQVQSHSLKWADTNSLVTYI